MTGHSEAQEVIARKWRTLGYTVIHRGAPDFLLLKEGEPPRFIEAKVHPAQPTEDQGRWLAALRSLGARADVETIGLPKTTGIASAGVARGFEVDQKRRLTIPKAARVAAGIRPCQPVELGWSIDGSVLTMKVIPLVPQVAGS
jgi:hypothetical protein